MDNGLVLKIPQQTMFGSFCKNHGCSVAAVSIALQIFGIKMSPYAVYKWCKENLRYFLHHFYVYKGAAHELLSETAP